MLADSTLISAGAFLFSGISLFVALRTRADQAALARRQIAAHDDGLVAKKRADVVAAVTTDQTRSGVRDVIEISNRGPAEARSIDISFPKRNSPFPEGTEKDLPIPVLRPGGSIRFLASISSHSHPPFHILLSWVDETGERRVEDTIG